MCFRPRTCHINMEKGGSTKLSDRASEDERITPIETERLRAFRDHPFKVTDDPEMSQLVESIRHYGILNPLIVRPLPEGV